MAVCRDRRLSTLALGLSALFGTVLSVVFQLYHVVYTDAHVVSYLLGFGTLGLIAVGTAVLAYRNGGILTCWLFGLGPALALSIEYYLAFRGVGGFSDPATLMDVPTDAFSHVALYGTPGYVLGRIVRVVSDLAVTTLCRPDRTQDRCHDARKSC